MPDTVPPDARIAAMERAEKAMTAAAVRYLAHAPIREVTNLSEGPVTLEMPFHLSDSSVADLEEWASLLFRRLRRRAEVMAGGEDAP